MRLCPVAAILVFSAFQVTQILDNDYFDLLKYQRINVENGQFHRLLTGQLVHINFRHTLADLSVLILLWLISLKNHFSKHFCLGLVFCLAGCAIGIHLFLIDLAWYAGSSAFLHGLFLIIAVILVKARPDVISYAMLILFLLKIIGELSGFVRINYGFEVINSSHILGMLWGLIYLVVFYRRKIF